MASTERPRLPGVPRLPDHHYYEVAKADHFAVTVKVKKTTASNNHRPTGYDQLVLMREIGPSEVDNWNALTAEGRVKAALTRVGAECVKRHNEEQMTNQMRAYVGNFDGAGAPL